MRILIANDDGIYSPGIAVLAEVAAKFGDVRIVAPDVEQSSAGRLLRHSVHFRTSALRSGTSTLTGSTEHPRTVLPLALTTGRKWMWCFRESI